LTGAASDPVGWCSRVCSVLGRSEPPPSRWLQQVHMSVEHPVDRAVLDRRGSDPAGVPVIGPSRRGHRFPRDSMRRSKRCSRLFTSQARCSDHFPPKMKILPRGLPCWIGLDRQGSRTPPPQRHHNGPIQGPSSNPLGAPDRHRANAAFKHLSSRAWRAHGRTGRRINGSSCGVYCSMRQREDPPCRP